MNNTTTMPKLADLFPNAQLPALPQSAIRLLELSQDTKNGPAEYAAPIEADPGLTVQVLRFVNSSYFGFTQEISSVRLAITLVGVRTIKNFALWSAVFSLMPNPKCGPFELRYLWQDSLRRGIFSRLIGKLLNLPESDDLFAAALLQDMALPLLAKEFPQQYYELFVGRDGGRKRLCEMEREAFGWTHADAGAMIARRWRLPPTFAELIESHTSLETLIKTPGARPGTLAVALSASLPSTVDTEWLDQECFLAAYQRICGNKANISKCVNQVDEQFAGFAPMLKLATPAKPLAELFNPKQPVA